MIFLWIIVVGEFLNQVYNGPNFCRFVTPLFQKTFKILPFFYLAKICPIFYNLKLYSATLVMLLSYKAT